MQLTQFTDYSLRMLMYLAETEQKQCRVRDIAEYYGISYNHLVKVSHRLKTLGFTESSRGKNGGISLKPQTKQKKLGDIVLALEPHMHIVECFNARTNTCRITNNCRLKFCLKQATNSFIETLNCHTLEQITANRAQGHLAE